MNILMVSLGCDKNLCDSEAMLGLLRDNKFNITNDESEADIVIVNTCAFIRDAMEESIAENLRETDKDKKVLERVNRVAKKAKELAEELQRKVTVSELAENTGLSVKAIEDAMRMSGFAIEDLER